MDAQATENARVDFLEDQNLNRVDGAISETSAQVGEDPVVYASAFPLFGDVSLVSEHTAAHRPDVASETEPGDDACSIGSGSTRRQSIATLVFVGLSRANFRNFGNEGVHNAKHKKKQITGH